MKNIKISVIIPVYNVEKYIRQCIESVINQTLKDIEIIVVNDGTKDKSMKIIEEYISDRRILIINKENGGLSSARNLGMKLAKGKYIYFLDSDDWIERLTLEEIYSFAENNKLDIAIADIYFYDNETHKIIERKTKDNCSQKKGSYFWGNYGIEACNKLYKKNFLIDNNLFFEENIIYEDDLFTIITSFSTNKIRYLNKNYYYYRQNRKGSIMTSSIKDKRIKSLEIIISKIKELKEKLQKNEFSFLRLTIMEIYYLNIIYDITNKHNICASKIKELEQILHLSWKRLDKVEKKIIKKDLKKIINNENMYNINIFNKFYWQNFIFKIKGLKKILIKKLL